MGAFKATKRLRVCSILLFTLSAAILLFTPLPAKAESFQTYANGVWTAPCTWAGCGYNPDNPPQHGYPGSGDTAEVKHYVTVDATNQGIGTLILTGNLEGGANTLTIVTLGTWNSGTFGIGNYDNWNILNITHAGSIGVMNLGGTINNPVGSTINQNSTYQMVPNGSTDPHGTINNSGIYNIGMNASGTDADINNSIATGPVINNNATGIFTKTAGTGTSLVSGNIVFNNQGGTIAAQTGTLQIGNLTGNGGILNAATGAVLKIQASNLTGTYTGSGGGTVKLNNTFEGAATFNMPGNLLQWTGGSIKGELTNAGTLGIVTGAGSINPGTLNNNGIVNQTDTYQMYNAGILNNNGIYKITNDSDIGNSAAAGPVINNSATGTFTKTAGTGTSSVSQTIVFNNQGTVEVLSGKLTLGKVTQLSASSPNILTGGIWNIGAGSELSISSGGNISTNQGKVTLDGVGATFTEINSLADNQGTFAIKSGRNFTTSSNLLNTGTLNIGEGTTLQIKSTGNGVLTNNGAITGKGTIIGTINNSGTMSPGSSPGTMQITGDYVQDHLGILLIELGGTTQGNTYDWLKISGTATLDGMLDIDLYGGFTPNIGDSFTFLTAATLLDGTHFSSYEWAGMDSSYWDITYDYSADYAKLTYLGGGATSAVPEPTTLLLVALGLIGMAGFRRKLIN
jgi:hypothetical protein